jgi:hypothetical protein
MEILKRFLSSYTDHAEARLALLGELRAVAEARARAILGVYGWPAQTGGARGERILPKQLESGDDSQIWGEYAREADGAFYAGLWKQDTSQFWAGRGSGPYGGASSGLFRGSGNPLVSNLAMHSPTLTRLYRQWLPDIEYALQTRPSSYQLWNFWLAVQRAAGGRDLMALKAILSPAIGGSQDVLPPFVRTQWIQDCVARGEWRMAEDVAREAWEDLIRQDAFDGGVRQNPDPRGGRFMATETSLLSARAWGTTAEPYIDILLRMEKVSAADAVLQQWLGQGGWNGAAQRAGNMANRQGFADVGSRWAALAPTAPSSLAPPPPSRR